MPIFVYILLGIALVIALLLLSRVKLYVCYDESLRVYAKYLFFRYDVIPKTEKKPRKKKKERKKESESSQKKPPSEGTPRKDEAENGEEKSTLIKLWEIKNVLLSLIKKLFSKVHFKFIKLRVVVACEDASATALTYGVVNQGIAYIIEILRNISKVEVSNRAKISVETNFISRKSELEGKIELYISVFSLLLVGIHFFMDYVKSKLITEDKNGTDKTK